MQKRLISIISIVLIATLLLGILPAVHTVKAEGEGVATRGDYIYSLSADPDTGSVPAGFGTPESNGRIWTDKSVAVNGDHFDVNLKVLAQEYVSSRSDAVTSSIAADVVLVLDMTSSMKENLPKESGGSVQRAAAMTDSVNEAIDIITNTNPNNRIMAYTFYGTQTSPNISNILPLAHYTSTSTAESTVGKYVTYSSNTLRSSTTLQKDGVSYSFSQGMGNSTNTQFGIATAISGMIDAINSESDNSIERKPYVIVLTDGEATSISKNWYSENLNDLKEAKSTISTTTGGGENAGHRPELIATATILTSAIWKDRLEAAYDNYNGAGIHNGVEWFNIGLGIADSNNPDSATTANCMLNPNFLTGVEGSNVAGSTSAERIKYYLTLPEYAPAYTEKDYFENDNYVYISDEDGYATFANSYGVLMNAFTTLANIIKQGSAQVTLPIVYHEGMGGTQSDVKFTDVIGQGMYVTDIMLKPDGGTTIVGTDGDSDGVFEFSGYKMTVKVTEDASGQQTLEWTIPANEVAMFTFADREDLASGNYIAADPTTLMYSVQPTEEIGEGPGYSNAFDGEKNPLTTVTYEIPGDNSYYYDVVTDAEHKYVSSTLKTGLNNSTDKTENSTDSCPTSHAVSYTAVDDGTENASAVANATLGNNGKATLAGYHTHLDIQVVKKWKDINGDEITDTSALPEITVKLYRTADGGATTELVESEELKNSNSYTTFWNVPRKDSSGNVYTYSVTEDPPDGYYIAGNTGPLNGTDGTITITNRVTPASGVISVQKLWKNKIGAAYTDTSMFSPIRTELWRKVSVYTPAKVNVKIYCDDGTNNYLVDDLDLEYGSELSFKLRTYIRTQANANNAVITHNGKTVASTRSYVYRSGMTLHYRETDEPQVFTVKEDTVINYKVSQTLNSAQVPLPCELIDLSKVDATATEGTTVAAPDEIYDTATLSTSNNWRDYFDNLPSAEVIDGKTYNYSYYVKEISDVDGFTASYSANNTEGITGGQLVITNVSNSNVPILPETGGKGTLTVMTLGTAVAVIAIAGALRLSGFSPHKKRRKSTN